MIHPVDKSSGRLTPIEEALQQLLQSVQPISGEEDLPLLQCQQRILAEDVFATRDVPGHDNSAMDGYALSSAQLRGGCTQFVVTQRIPAGAVGTPLEPGSAARIFTGAPVPAGADAVVMQENCQIDGSQLTVTQRVEAGENVRFQGDDFAKGDLLLSAGRRLGAADIGVLAAAGVAELRVKRRLRVVLLTTGNELVRPGEDLQPGQIYNSNFFTLNALLQNMDVDVVDGGIVGDSLSFTEQALQIAAQHADCVISSGGVSAGEEDHVRAAVQTLGTLDLWRLALKPGKPFAFGQINGKPFFGLPGNPVSAFVTFVLLVRPCLFRAMGVLATSGSNFQPQEYLLPAGFTLATSGVRQEYLRVTLQNESGKSPKLMLFSRQSSGILSSLSQSSGLAIVPPFTAVTHGDMLRYLPYSELLY